MNKLKIGFLVDSLNVDYYVWDLIYHIKKSDLPFVTGKIVCTKDYYINTGSKYDSSTRNGSKNISSS